MRWQHNNDRDADLVYSMSKGVVMVWTACKQLVKMQKHEVAGCRPEKRLP